MLYNKKKSRTLFEIFTYLFLGGLIYVLVRDPIPLFTHLFKISNWKTSIVDISLLPDVMAVFVKYHLPDVLWGLSFYTAVEAIIKKPFIALAIVFTFTVLYELAQYFSIVSGTGDWWDIIFTVCAVAINMIIKRLVRRNEKKY